MPDAERAKRVPFFKSLRTKYALTYLAVIAAVLVLMNTYPILASQSMAFRSKQTSLQSQASVIASALAGPDGLSAESVMRVMEVLGDTGLSRVMVTDPSGLVLYDTEERGDVVGKYTLFYEVVEALRYQDVFRSDFTGGAFYSRGATPVTYRGMTQGAVYVSEQDVEQGQLLIGIQQTLRSASFVIAAVALGMSLLFSRALTGRIGNLLEAIRNVREGQYSHRVAVTGGDELSRMAEEFNNLTNRLQTTEEVRRRFVSDASHELKTPLASIRLLSDSILQSDQIDPETVREFVGDIGSEAERLTRITEHLLALTRLDATPAVEAEAVDVSQVVRRAEHMLSPLARANELELLLELEEGIQVRCTGDDLYQIVFNLMENAIKYNLPQGKVWVRSRAEGGRAILTVEDTGVGIPEKDMDKIFDRFYRVDKARSRAAGGTGLGLSIVQDTARRHGGSVRAKTREGGGAVFTVSLPLWREGAGT